MLSLAQRQALNRDGYLVLHRLLAPERLSEAWQEIDATPGDPGRLRRGGRIYGGRNLGRLPAVVQIATTDPVCGLMTGALGPAARLVRALFFDKSQAANWSVGWHQDRMIAVRQRHEIEGFGPWSLKAGVPHVEPPCAILENLLTIRLHGDPCGSEQGPLQVIPGSHRAGRLTQEEIDDRVADDGAVECLVPAGGAVLMRPLLLHASSRATAPGQRRVLHLEFAGCELPPPLAWAE